MSEHGARASYYTGASMEISVPDRGGYRAAGARHLVACSRGATFRVRFSLGLNGIVVMRERERSRTISRGSADVLVTIGTRIHRPSLARRASAPDGLLSISTEADSSESISVAGRAAWVRRRGRAEERGRANRAQEMRTGEQQSVSASQVRHGARGLKHPPAGQKN